jgi:hypothetical protein
MMFAPKVFTLHISENGIGINRRGCGGCGGLEKAIGKSEKMK